MSLYLDQILNGDFVALSTVRQVLQSCLERHRNQLLANMAFGIESPREVNECDASELTDLVGTIDVAVQHGLNRASAPDTNYKIARLG